MTLTPAEHVAPSPATAAPPEDKPLRFRKKPVVIEAWQATGIREMGRIVKWINGNEGEASYRAPVNFGPAVAIRTLEGTMEARLADWIIRGVQGEFYPCKPDIFEATYEAVDTGAERDSAERTK